MLLCKQNDNVLCWCGRIMVGVMFCIHMHVWKGRKLIPVLSDNCVQQPIIARKMTKRWQNTLVWMRVWTSITEEIFYPGSEGKALTQREETRYILSHRAFISITSSNTRHLNSTDDSPGILYQLSAWSSHIKCLTLSLLKSWLFFQQNEQKGEDALPTRSLEIAGKTALFTTKFARDARSSPLTSLPLVLGILNDQAPENLKLNTSKIRHKTWQWLWTQPH